MITRRSGVHTLRGRYFVWSESSLYRECLEGRNIDASWGANHYLKEFESRDNILTFSVVLAVVGEIPLCKAYCVHM